MYPVTDPLVLSRDRIVSTQGKGRFFIQKDQKLVECTDIEFDRPSRETECDIDEDGAPLGIMIDCQTGEVAGKLFGATAEDVIKTLSNIRLEKNP